MVSKAVKQGATEGIFYTKLSSRNQLIHDLRSVLFSLHRHMRIDVQSGGSSVFIPQVYLQTEYRVVYCRQKQGQAPGKESEMRNPQAALSAKQYRELYQSRIDSLGSVSVRSYKTKQIDCMIS